MGSTNNNSSNGHASNGHHSNGTTNGKITSGKHFSAWIDNDFEIQKLNPLTENLETDVVIIGGGIAGLSTAYRLCDLGKSVVLVEDGFIGSGETGRTSAHLVTAIDERYYDLERIFGEEKTKLIAEAHRTGIYFIEAIVTKEKIDCDFDWVDGYLMQHPSDKADSLDMEYKAAKKAGLDVEVVNEIPGILVAEKGLRFSRQAQFHPLKYIRGLAAAIERKGGKIFTGTKATRIDSEGIDTESGYTVRAKHTVVATNSPVNNLFAIHVKQNAYRTYMIGAKIKKGLIPKALWWDTGDFSSNSNIPPYHYVRTLPFNGEFDILLCGGEDHVTGDTSQGEVPEEKRYALIEDWARTYFPIEDIVYRWSGQVMEPIDGVAFIGRNPMDSDNVYVISGDSGNGLTHGSFAGLLISDLITGINNKWERIFRPSRFTLKESGPVFKQMMHEFISYLRHRPNFKSAQELSSIKNGEGRIVDMLEEKFGVYRDEYGMLHIVSAECTHLKCTIGWNKDEQSWDCPCHGSRFDYEGKVLNGPANIDLPAYREVNEELIRKQPQHK
jgi:glycine/D-amino acid oxidase-like deaminating enzyme/nitrite reductase/ring-hydroxylating ferredoxin subunit